MSSLRLDVENFLKDKISAYNLGQKLTKMDISEKNSDDFQKAIDLLIVHEEEVRQLRQLAQLKLRRYILSDLKMKLLLKDDIEKLEPQRK